MYIEGLDTKDNEILYVIKNNARLSYSDIGNAVGLSRVAVKNRMEAMEKRGIIQGYQTVINATKVSEGVKFIIDVETTSERYNDVLDVLATDRYIRQVYGTTGNCRIHCQGFAPNTKTLDTHVRYLYNNTAGIRRLEWHMLITTYKDKDGGVDYEKRSSFKGNDGAGTGCKVE